MKTLLLIDGNAIMHRAFHAIPPNFRTKDGIPTNAVYGFMAMLLKCISDFQPTHIMICFDTPKPTFRKELFEQYQAHRAKITDEFRVQIPFIKEMIDKAGVSQIEKEGYEADDLIGTLVEKYKKDARVLILTGDKDIMQLVDENVFVISPQTGVSSIKLYDSAEVKLKLGIEPYEIPDFKGLMGDPSDNYSGAKGVGPKTAAELLKRFGTVENLLEHVSEIENLRLQTIIKEHREQILLSKKLATIMRDVPIQVSLDSTAFNGFSEELKSFLGSLQMNSLIERIYNQKAKPVKKEKSKEVKQEDVDQAKLF